MSKLGIIRITEVPKFKAISSGLATNEEIFGKGGFCEWFDETHNKKMVKNIAPYEAPDFMWHEEDKSVWIWAVEDWVTESDAAPYELIEFEGGIYVVATADENDNADINEACGSMVKWIEDSGVFERDERPGHRGMGHRIGCGAIQEVTGMAQQEIFLPVKLKEKNKHE